MSRKSGVLFEPQQVIEEVKSEAVGRRMFKPREQYLQRYLEVSVFAFLIHIHVHVHAGTRTTALF